MLLNFYIKHLQFIVTIISIQTQNSNERKKKSVKFSSSEFGLKLQSNIHLNYPSSVILISSKISKKKIKNIIPSP